MYPRTEYEMTEEDLRKLIKAYKPVTYIITGEHDFPPSPQEKANNAWMRQNARKAWMRLGKKMGFDSATVKPINGKGNRFFTAVPSDTD